MKNLKFLVCVLILNSSVAFCQISGAGQIGCSSAPMAGTAWNSSTTVNTTQTLAGNIAGVSVTVVLDQTLTITAGAVSFYLDYGDGNLVQPNSWQVVDPTSSSFATISLPYSLVASTNKIFEIQMGGAYKLVLKLTTAITGSGSITPYTNLVCYTAPVQANVANTPNVNVQSNASVNLNQLGGTGLGAPSNYGTSPGAVAVQGVNAYVTNTVPVSGTFWQTNQPVNVEDASNNKVTSNSTTYTGKYALDVNLLGSDGAAFGTAGVIDHNTKQIGGSAVSTAATGVQLVGTADGSGNKFVGDPCQLNAKSYFSDSITASTQEITGTTSKHTYICSLNVLSASAENVAIVEGTGTTCGTSVAKVVGLSGGTTAATGWNLAANGGLTFGNGASSIGEAANATGDNVCFLLSGSTQVNIGGSYVQY